MNNRTAAGLAAVAMSTLGLVMVAAPAHASSAGVLCFQQPNGYPWNMETAIQVNNANVDSGWQTVASGIPNSAGCLEFTLAGDYQNLYVRGYTNYSMPGAIFWEGVTPLVGLPGDQYADLGIGVVHCIPASPSVPCPAGTQ